MNKKENPIERNLLVGRKSKKKVPERRKSTSGPLERKETVLRPHYTTRTPSSLLFFLYTADLYHLFFSLFRWIKQACRHIGDDETFFLELDNM